MLVAFAISCIDCLWLLQNNVRLRCNHSFPGHRSMRHTMDLGSPVGDTSTLQAAQLLCDTLTDDPKHSKVIIGIADERLDRTLTHKLTKARFRQGLGWLFRPRVSPCMFRTRILHCGDVRRSNVFTYIARVPNRNSPPAVLLRESYREGKKVIKRTLANLSTSATLP